MTRGRYGAWMARGVLQVTPHGMSGHDLPAATVATTEPHVSHVDHPNSCTSCTPSGRTSLFKQNCQSPPLSLMLAYTHRTVVIHTVNSAR